MKDSELFQERFNDLERIGGTFSHLQTEFKSDLQQFKSIKLTPKQKFDFKLMQSFFLLFE